MDIIINKKDFNILHFLWNTRSPLYLKFAKAILIYLLFIYDFSNSYLLYLNI